MLGWSLTSSCFKPSPGEESEGWCLAPEPSDGDGGQSQPLWASVSPSAFLTSWCRR